MNRRALLIAITGAAAVGLVGVGLFAGLGHDGVKVGIKEAAASCKDSGTDCLPSLTYVDTDGRVWGPEALSGQVVIVNFWATWCAPCVHEIPAFAGIHHAYEGKGVVVLGVMTDDPSHANLETFVQRHKLSYPVVRADREILSAFEYPSSLPTTFIYDRRGKLRKFHRGPLTAATLERVLGKLIAETKS